MKKILFSCIIVLYMCNAVANDKISKQLALDLKNASKNKQNIEIYLLLKNRKPIKTHASNNRYEKINQSIKQLQENAKKSQETLEPLVKKLSQSYTFYWINNSLWAELDVKSAKQLIAQNEVIKAFSNKKQHLQTIKPRFHQSKKTVKQILWNINLIKAPEVWAQGIKGQGVLIAGQDTGYQWNHAALKNQYAGWDGSNVDHNYHWHDAITNPIINCGTANQPESCDDHGHGSHTMGTMVGDDGAGNQIGVAPDAKWIGCRNMNQGAGTPATYTECFQFFMQPTDLSGNNPDVSKAPSIINNSWGCDATEGCINPNALESVVNNVVDAGILVVAAAGNSGPGCNTVESPIAIYHKSLTIGSTKQDETISIFSSQGGVTADSSGRLKPDLVAPGSGIKSVNIYGGYITFDGTSMASPHVAGVAALMLSANPAMQGKPKIIKQVLLRTAQIRASQQTCSQIPGSQIPNNTFGWGRVDALAAVNQIKDIIFLDNFANF